MNNQDAIDLLNQEKVPIILNGKNNERLIVAHIKAIESLEKQIPKPLTMSQFYDIMTQKIIHGAKCPRCGEKLVIIEFLAEKERIYKENSSYNYCCNCGQAISWEVDK